MNGKVLDDLPMDLEQIRNKNPIIKTFLAGLVVVIIAAVAQFCVYVSPEQGQPVQEIADTAIEPININTATVEELAILPEITPHLAGKIVAYRKRHGRFGRADDLLRINGINEEILRQFEVYITVE